MLRVVRVVLVFLVRVFVSVLVIVSFGQIVGCGGGERPPPAPPTPAPPPHQWPEFKSKDELQNSTWGCYFAKVYGEVPNSGYPISTYALSLIYNDIANTCGLNTLLPLVQPMPPPGHGGIEYTCSFTAGLFFENTAPVLLGDLSWKAKNFSYIWHGCLQYPYPCGQPLPSHTSVEVLHSAFKGDGNGTWLYYMPGSGIYLQLGKTRAYYSHAEAVQDLVGANCPDYECSSLFSELYAGIQRAGLDTIQILHHADQTFCWVPFPDEKVYGLLAVEIIDPSGPGRTACGSCDAGLVPLLRYRAGWQASKPCLCENAGDLDHASASSYWRHLLNCKGYGLSIGNTMCAKAAITV